MNIYKFMNLYKLGTPELKSYASAAASPATKRVDKKTNLNMSALLAEKQIFFFHFICLLAAKCSRCFCGLKFLLRSC